MYISVLSHIIGERTPIDTLPELARDPDALQYLKNLELKWYSQIHETKLESSLTELLSQALTLSKPLKVDALLFGTSFYNHARHKHLPGLLLERSGLKDSIPFNISMGGCANFILALQVAQGFFEGDLYDTLCLVTGDIVGDVSFSRVFPGKNTIGSDGFVCCMLSHKDKGLPHTWKIKGIHQSIRPSMYNKTYDKHLLDYINLYTEGFTEVVEKTYAYPVCPENLRWLIAGNFNRSVLRNFAHLAGMSPDKIAAPGLSEVAHCFSADQLMAVKTLDEQSKTVIGDQVMMIGSGDYLWGSLLMEKIH